MKKCILSFVYLILTYAVMASDATLSKGPKIEWGVSPIKNDWISELFLNKSSVWLPTIGIFVHDLRGQSAWSTYYQASFGMKTINDDCNCNDHFYGQGKYKAWEAIVGKRYTFGFTKDHALQVFVQPGIRIGYSQYKGDFDGGIMGNGYTFSHQLLSFDLDARIGFQYKLNSKFSLAVSGALRPGWGFKEINHEHRSTGIVASVNAFQLNIGYLLYD